MRVQMLLMVCLACLGSTFGAYAQGPPPAPVRLAEVISEDVAEHRMVTGELRSLRIAEVASQEAGVVIEMLIEVGMRVEAGQVLAKLDDERLELEKRRTTAERAAAESVVAEEEAAHGRWLAEVESLRAANEQGASTARELRDATAELHQAIARHEKSKRDVEVYDARLALLERRLRDMQILAPFAGTVTQKLSERGQWVSAGNSLCELVQTDELELVLDVPQRYLPVLAERLAHETLLGQDLVVGLDTAETTLTIDNLRIVPKIDERSRTFKLLGRVYNPDDALASGLSVVGWIPTGTSGEHLIVPTDAVMRNDMGAYVYVARHMGPGPAKAMPATIEVLFEMPGRVVIEAASLKPGDQVVVEGNDRLYPTAPVRAIDQAPDTENAGRPTGRPTGAPAGRPGAQPDARPDARPDTRPTPRPEAG